MLASRSAPRTPHPVLPPDRWEGETGCRVGPFRDLRSAEGFANALVDFGRYETLCEQVVVDDEGVYVDVKRAFAGAVAASAGGGARRARGSRAATGKPASTPRR